MGSASKTWFAPWFYVLTCFRFSNRSSSYRILFKCVLIPSSSLLTQWLGVHQITSYYASGIFEIHVVTRRAKTTQFSQYYSEWLGNRKHTKMDWYWTKHRPMCIVCSRYTHDNTFRVPQHNPCKAGIYWKQNKTLKKVYWQWEKDKVYWKRYKDAVSLINATCLCLLARFQSKLILLLLQTRTMIVPGWMASSDHRLHTGAASRSKHPAVPSDLFKLSHRGSPRNRFTHGSHTLCSGPPSPVNSLVRAQEPLHHWGEIPSCSQHLRPVEAALLIQSQEWLWRRVSREADPAGLSPSWRTWIWHK